MGRSARSLGVKLGSIAAMVAAVLVVTAPLASAKAPPPASTPATTSPPATKAPDAKPAESKPAKTPPPPTTAPATTATTDGTTAKTGDPAPPGDVVIDAAPPIVGPIPPIGPIGPPPPPRENSKITVTPNTGLQDLQSVQIEASGFTPDAQVGAAQCRVGGTDVSDCDISGSVITTSDADGSWTATIVVSARIRVGDEVVDCRKKNSCAIGAARLYDYQEVAGAPIAFDPGIVFPPAPVVTVTPSTGLAHDQQVTVTGTGFPPGSRLFAQECTDREPYPVCSYETGPVEEIVADDTGAVSAAFTVKRFLGYPGELLVDCADADCYLQLSAESDQFAIDRAELRFDPDGPLPPRPTASASPNRDLVHNQEVSLTGTGFAPFEPVQISQCSLDADPFPVCSYSPIVPVGGFAGPIDGDGNLAATFGVRRQVGYGGPGGTVIDCAEKPGCVLRVSSYDDLLHSVDVPIAFDPDVPLPPSPTLEVRPNRDLLHNSVVTVTGDGFLPNDLVQLSECLEVDGQTSFCSYGGRTAVFADGDGAFTTTFTAKRVFGNNSTVVLDCVEDGECAVYASSISDSIATAEQELHFDADAPLPDPPVLTMEPSSGLPWRGVVHLSGSGFSPNTQHNVIQCSRESSPIGAFPCSYGPAVAADAEGNIDADISLRRLIEGFPEPFDCAPDNCALTVSTYEDPLSSATVALNFDPNSSPPPAPKLTVSRNDELAEGSTITVSGAGFSPNALVGVSQCRGGDDLAPKCDGSIIQFAGADANGEFTTEYTVRPGIWVQSGIVGCYDAPGACTLRAAAFGLPDEVSEAVPLVFGGKAPPGFGIGGAGEPGPDLVKAPTPVRTAPAPRLALTGTPVRGYLEFAAIFLGLGTLLVLAGRRRRIQV